MFEKYIGKSYKYLAITNKSFKKHAENYKHSDKKWELSIDELYNILTPGSSNEVLFDMVPKNMTDKMCAYVITIAGVNFTRIIGILQAKYWNTLSDIIKAQKLSPYELMAEILQLGTRNSYMLYRYITELYVYITVLRNANSNTNSDIQYD